MPSSGKPELQQFFQASIKEMNTMSRELKCGNPTPLSQTTPFILHMSMPGNCDGGHTHTWLWERFLKNRSQGSSISLESHPFSSFPHGRHAFVQKQAEDLLKLAITCRSDRTRKRRVLPRQFLRHHLRAWLPIIWDIFNSVIQSCWWLQHIFLPTT